MVPVDARCSAFDDLRRRFIPEVPEGYVSLADGATVTGLARQAILSAS
jgi:hypothetical protein